MKPNVTSLAGVGMAVMWGGEVISVKNRTVTLKTACAVAYLTITISTAQCVRREGFGILALIAV